MTVDTFCSEQTCVRPGEGACLLRAESSGRECGSIGTGGGLACSGLQYAAVPLRTWKGLAAVTDERPQSHSSHLILSERSTPSTPPRQRTITLLGRTSRCTCPCLCMCSSARATWSITVMYTFLDPSPSGDTCCSHSGAGTACVSHA